MVGQYPSRGRTKGPYSRCWWCYLLAKRGVSGFKGAGITVHADDGVFPRLRVLGVSEVRPREEGGWWVDGERLGADDLLCPQCRNGASDASTLERIKARREAKGKVTSEPQAEKQPWINMAERLSFPPGVSHTTPPRQPPPQQPSLPQPEAEELLTSLLADDEILAALDKSTDQQTRTAEATGSHSTSSDTAKQLFTDLLFMAADEGSTAQHGAAGPTDAVHADTTNAALPSPTKPLIAPPLAATPPQLIVESSQGEIVRGRSWHSPTADAPLAAASAAPTADETYDELLAWLLANQEDKRVEQAAAALGCVVRRVLGSEAGERALAEMVVLTDSNMNEFSSARALAKTHGNLLNKATRIIEVREQGADATLVAFAAYRLNVDECSALTSYLYELQLDVAVRGAKPSLGKALIGEVEEHAGHAGSGYLHLSVTVANVKALGFYEHLGYEPDDKLGERVEDGVRMRTYAKNCARHACHE